MLRGQGTSTSAPAPQSGRADATFDINAAVAPPQTYQHARWQHALSFALTELIVTATRSAAMTQGLWQLATTGRAKSSRTEAEDGGLLGAMRHFASYIFLALALVAQAAATPKAPVFTLNGYSSGHFTNNASVDVDVTNISNVTDKTWCIGEESGLPDCTWFSIDGVFLFSLTGGNALQTVYLQYKTASGTLSDIGSASITLDTTTPTVALYSPAGISGMTQALSLDNSQFVTGYVADGCGTCNDPVTVYLEACYGEGSCSPWETIAGPTLPPFVFTWPSGAIWPISLRTVRIRRPPGSELYAPIREFLRFAFRRASWFPFPSGPQPEHSSEACSAAST